MHRNHEYSLNTEEFQYYLRLCNAIQNSLFPTLHRNFQQLCPISAISQKFSLTTSELSKMDTTKSYELDIKTPIDEIGNVIKEISSKSL